MKQNIISIAKPCSEKWEKMTPNKKGHFCDSCSKTVIDFTHSSQEEIKRHLKVNKTTTCGRIRQSQLEQPFITHKKTYQFKLPYKNITTGLLIASSLSLTQSCSTGFTEVKTHSLSKKVLNTSIKIQAGSKIQINKPQIIDSTKTIIIKGKITSELDSNVIDSAEITLITLNKIITTHSDRKGNFSLEVPYYLIKKKNVLQTNFHDYIQHPIKGENIYQFMSFKKENIILDSIELSNNLNIMSKPDFLVMGEFVTISEKHLPTPIVINNGKEIEYKEFLKAQEGKKSSCNIENKEFYYFDGDAAIALYGEKAKNGLYLYLPQ